MATIYEVAERAGVSPATVSRVFNGTPVSPEYAERVHQAAAELDFTPNRTARKLRRQRSEVIALVIPDIENPFFTAMARGVEDRAAEAGYSVVLCNSDEDEDKESRYLAVALSEHMAGVVLAPASDHPDLDALVARHTPVVAVDRPARGYDLDTVQMDDVALGAAAASRLHGDGHRVVGCITGPPAVGTAADREAGWRKAFTEHSPALNPDDYLRYSNYRVDGGRTAMESLLALESPPDAVFVANNLMGVGAMQTPGAEDTALLVLGDLPFGMLHHPGITIVSLPARNLGTTAADMLLDRIGGDDAAPRRVVLDDTT